MQDVIVAFGSPEDSRKIKAILQRNGYRVSTACTSGARVLTAMEELDGGAVICGYRLSDMSFAELSENIPRGWGMLLVTAPRRIEDMDLSDNIVLLPLPLKVQNLLSSLDVMLESQRRLRKRERARRRQQPRSTQEQRILNTAKDILMERNNMTEPEAHRYLQKCAMDSGNNIVEVAQMVLEFMRV